MNFIYALLASIVFAFVDYVGYNTIGVKGKTPLVIYRVIQTAFQIWLLYVLWLISPRAAFGFAFIWWTFLCDFAYYGFCNIGWFGLTGSAFKDEILGDKVTWAWWTPWGLYKWATTKVRNSVIDGPALIFQGALGLFVALAITKVI